MSQRYWMNTISLEHVRLGVEGGFTQADHGRDTRLRRLRQGDGIAFYSPRTAMRQGSSVQQFTAFGTVSGAEPYQVTVREDFRPWRLAVDFRDAAPADVRPLVGRLAFVTDPDRWGFPFRRGLFEISADDFEVVATAMGDG